MSNALPFLQQLRGELDAAGNREQARASVFRRISLATASFAVVAVLCFASGMIVAQHPTPAVAGTVLSKIAQSYAAEMGENDPGSMNYVLTTRSAANVATSGSPSDSNESVYLLILTGHFTNKNGFGPHVSGSVVGTVLTVVVDASNYQVQDLGLSDNLPKPIDGAPAGAIHS
jgi:hypothetical protein